MAASALHLGQARKQARRTKQVVSRRLANPALTLINKVSARLSSRLALAATSGAPVAGVHAPDNRRDCLRPLHRSVFRRLRRHAEHQFSAWPR
jgi:hypothetical protein